MNGSPAMLGPVAQESVVDSALLRSIFRPFKPAFLYTSCTQIAREERATLLLGCPSSGRRRQRASKSGLSMFGLLDYRGWARRRLHSPRAERMKVKPPSPPSAQSVQTKKKPPVDLAISP